MRPVRPASGSLPALQAAGVGCVIAAPGKIERAAQDRFKTDQRDAERLVRLLMVDALHSVRLPGPGEEALRDPSAVVAQQQLPVHRNRKGRVGEITAALNLPQMRTLLFGQLSMRMR